MLDGGEGSKRLITNSGRPTEGIMRSCALSKDACEDLLGMQQRSISVALKPVTEGIWSDGAW